MKTKSQCVEVSTLNALMVSELIRANGGKRPFDGGRVALLLHRLESFALELLDGMVDAAGVIAPMVAASRVSPSIVGTSIIASMVVTMGHREIVTDS